MPEVSSQPGNRLELRTPDFDGSYVSLVTELDADEAKRIGVGVELVAKIELSSTPEQPAYLRAHFSNEEGREVLHDLIVIAEGAREVRFNLDGLRIPLDLVTAAWVDLVFSVPKGFVATLTRFDLEIEG